MKLLALISGGKDSVYSILCARRLGHEVVLLGHMIPRNSNTHELDSYMFQTIGHNTVKSISECLEIPLIERIISGFSSSTQLLTYTPDSLDEVEDLYYLVEDALKLNDGIEGVVTGAICSRYQLERVKSVCSRLKLESINPLWERDQSELLAAMIKDKMEAIIVKTCSLGLNENHLGKTVSELYEVFTKMRDKFGFNVCGEGGEYESLVLDCTMYKKRIVIEEHEKIYHSMDPYAPTILYVPIKWRLESKE
ncbi:diphthine--ammonia ligase [Theileria orientalis]|uniref:Diphthine--ammonia ligase n=1 Tax=Theileria orientalis TaxID=68886 RepID=A0A976SJA8_THEOR|nr:diphthine--ammonia ligase [Theileria orientalis]